MPIKENQALTPEKKQVLVEQIQTELSNITKTIKDKNYAGASLLVLQQSQTDLQNILNKLLEKKGVVTPSETNSALLTMGEAKKAMLQEEYIMGMRKATFYLLTLGILGVATYLLIKKGKK